MAPTTEDALYLDDQDSWSLYWSVGVQWAPVAGGTANPWHLGQGQTALLDVSAVLKCFSTRAVRTGQGLVDQRFDRLSGGGDGEHAGGPHVFLLYSLLGHLLDHFPQR